MKHNKFPKGSNWNVWDLHIHTPESVLNNNFGNDWDVYVQKLFRKAIKNEIIAIGITDYYTIDGYKKLKKEYLENDAKLQELFSDDEVEYIKTMLILPNIEFRIEKLVIGKEPDLKWNRKINFHLLLSNEISIEDIEENLLSKLTFEDYGVGEGIPQERSITKRSLTTLGQEIKEQHSQFQDEEDLFVGMMNASIKTTHLVKTLSSQDKIFKGKYLLGVPADEDLSDVSWNSQGYLTRKTLIQKSHFIFSSNKKTIKFCLGNFHPSKGDFVNEFKSLKPCIWGSDAHDFDKLFLPDMGRKTWIKANPTFEGLKQIIYEPKDRVRIQLNKPEEKTPYLVIDKVRFIDNTNRNIFSPEWIHLNENLNVIVGGKSSGKSLLLYHIAKTIDSNEIDKKQFPSSSTYQEFRRKHPFDFEVVWKNKDKNLLSSDEIKNQITYIPQLYINHLAEKDGKNKLHYLISDILQQNEDFKEYLNTFQAKKEEAKNNISSNINYLLQLTDKAKVLQSEIAQIGTEQQINNEIKRLTVEIKVLREQSNFKPEENKRYEELIKAQAQLESKSKSLNNKINALYNFQKEIQKNQQITLNTVNSRAAQFNGASHENVKEDINFLKEELLDNLKKSYSQFYLSLKKKTDLYEKELEETKKKISEVARQLKPFLVKVKNQDLLKNISDGLKIQTGKLEELKKKEREKKEVLENGIENNRILFDNYSKLFEYYKEVIVTLSDKEYKNIGEDLELQTKLEFDAEAFSNSFGSLFDKRGNFKDIFDGRFDVENTFVYVAQQHIDNIKIIFNKIRKEKDLLARLRKWKDRDEQYAKLFDDYFKFSYSIVHKGDNILEMSPGKRGLVLLQLILHISNATHPILIDQPEDNLDNRTIYYELKEFIKDKKTKRQIILVTHNSNLVVSTDAENIIVANQSGQQLGKEKRKHQFEYISGGLENNFSKPEENGILFQLGIREHVCDILEGGIEAFKKREQRYGI